MELRTLEMLYVYMFLSKTLPSLTNELVLGMASVNGTTFPINEGCVDEDGNAYMGLKLASKSNLAL